MNIDEIAALKEKLFLFGLYGTWIETFKESELQLLITQLWVEIVSVEQIELLKRSFTQVSLTDHRRKFLTTQKNIPIKEFFKGMIIRMNTIEWKNHLSVDFKFVNPKFYLVLDSLLKKKGASEIAEIRKTFDIKPKMMFYMIKKLLEVDLIEKVDEEFIRIKRGGKRKEKLLEEHCGQKIQFLMNFPFEAWIRKIIYESKNGISSNDLSKIAGIPIKMALKMLKKFEAKNKSAIKSVETFEGKIRRHKFYKISQFLEARKEKNPENNVIWGEDREEVLKELVEKDKIIPIDKAHLSLIKEKLGANYNLDKRTILNIANKIGYQVIKKKGKSSFYFIATPDYKEIEEVKQKTEEFTPFQKEIYDIFVLKSPSFKKNGYEPRKEERIKLLYNFITEYMNKNGLKSVNFDMDLIGSLTLEKYFRLFNVNNQLRKDLKKFIELKNLPPSERFKTEESNITSLKKKQKKKKENSQTEEVYSEEISDELTEKRITLEDFTLKDALSFEDSELRDQFIERYKINKHMGILNEIIECNIFKVIEGEVNVLEPTSVNFDILNLQTEQNRVSSKDKKEFFKNVKDFSENNFYNECFSFIYLNYDSKKYEFFKSRLESFKKSNSLIYKSPTLPAKEFKKENKALFKFIKKIIINNHKLYLTDLLKEGYFYSDIDYALIILSSDKFIAGYKSIYNLEMIHLNDYLKKKLSLNLSEFNFNLQKDYKKNDYYSFFFNFIYFLFVTQGSYQKESLLKACDFFDEEELLEFLQCYSEFFKVEFFGNSYVVELL